MLLAIAAFKAEGRSFLSFQVCHLSIPPSLLSGDFWRRVPNLYQCRLCERNSFSLLSHLPDRIIIAVLKQRRTVRGQRASTKLCRVFPCVCTGVKPAARCARSPGVAWKQPKAGSGSGQGSQSRGFDPANRPVRRSAIRAPCCRAKLILNIRSRALTEALAVLRHARSKFQTKHEVVAGRAIRSL
jgi:hypothetical protein